MHPDNKTAEEEADNDGEQAVPVEEGVEEAKRTGRQHATQRNILGCKVGNRKNRKPLFAQQLAEAEAAAAAAAEEAEAAAQAAVEEVSIEDVAETPAAEEEVGE